MKIYSFEIADMEVSVLCNGLDNLMKNLPYEGKEAKGYDEADAIILFSAKMDKPILKTIEKIENEGVNAGLLVMLTAEEGNKVSDTVDMKVLAKEPYLSKALSSLLTMLDYYTHINSVDIGYELADSGAFSYIPSSGDEAFSLIPKTVSEKLSGAKEAILLLEAGEDIWISEMDALCGELSSLMEDAEIKVVASRTLEGGNVKCSLFKKID